MVPHINIYNKLTTGEGETSRGGSVDVDTCSRVTTQRYKDTTEHHYSGKLLLPAPYKRCCKETQRL